MGRIQESSSCRVFLAILALISCSLSPQVRAKQDTSSPEELFHQTVQAWRAPQGYQYKPWEDLSVNILERFKKEKAIKSTKVKAPPPRLELIGALEESLSLIHI